MNQHIMMIQVCYCGPTEHEGARLRVMDVAGARSSAVVSRDYAVEAYQQANTLAREYAREHLGDAAIVVPYQDGPDTWHYIAFAPMFLSYVLAVLVEDIFRQADLVEPNMAQATVAAMAESAEMMQAILDGTSREQMGLLDGLLRAIGRFLDAAFAASGDWNRTNPDKEQALAKALDNLTHAVLGVQVEASILGHELNMARAEHGDAWTQEHLLPAGAPDAAAFAKETGQTVMMAVKAWLVNDAGGHDPMSALVKWAERHKRKTARA